MLAVQYIDLPSSSNSNQLVSVVFAVQYIDLPSSSNDKQFVIVVLAVPYIDLPSSSNGNQFVIAVLTVQRKWGSMTFGKQMTLLSYQGSRVAALQFQFPFDDTTL